MKFEIEVGEVAKERVEFSFNQLMGRTIIRSNGREVKRSVRWFSEPVVDTHVIDFAQHEKVNLTIEKRRRQLFGAQYFVYINNRLVAYYKGI
jgi:hypothetical protein